MPITMLDPVSALIVVDLQQGTTARPAAHPIAPVVENAAMLARAFRCYGLPVILVNVDGAPSTRTEVPSSVAGLPEGWTVLVPELDAQPSDYRVSKQSWGAFTNTDLHSYLQTQGVTQVVLAGVATSIGVETTARQARERGYNVALATDAMTDGSAEAHENSITRIFPRLGETGTTAAIVAMLERR